MRTAIRYSLFILLLTKTVLAAEIEKIHFKGDRTFSGRELREVVHSRKGENYEPRLVRLDKLLLTNFFKSKGWLEPQIRDSLNYLDGRKKVELFYIVEPGRRYYFGGVFFTGQEELSEKTLHKAFQQVVPGQPYNESLVNAAILNVEDAGYNAGKPFISLKSRFEIKSDSLLILNLTISENQTVYIKEITYNGLQQVQKFIIRREVEIKKGEIYNRKKIDRSQQNIYSTGLFNYVRLEIEPVTDLPDQAILKIFVQEKESRWIGFRFGLAHEQEQFYGSKFEITLQGGHRNIAGTARSVSLNLTPSVIFDVSSQKILNPENKIFFTYVEPWIGYTRTPGILQLGFQQYRHLNSSAFNLLSSSFDVRHKFEKNVELSASVSAKFLNRLNDIEIDENLNLGFLEDQSQIYALTFYGKQDARNNYFMPTNGALTDLSLTLSHSSGQADNGSTETNEYLTLTSSWSRYLPFRPKVLDWDRWNFVLATRFKAGAIFEPLGRKTIPISDLFFAGGGTTVRGYQEQLLGPALAYDEDGNISAAAGGKLIYLNNAEVRMPLFWILVMQVFIDGGYVWREINEFDYRDIRFSSGAGLSFLTPLGPIRFDYGYKLMPTRQDAEPGTYHIGIYFAF